LSAAILLCVIPAEPENVPLWGIDAAQAGPMIVRVYLTQQCVKRTVIDIKFRVAWWLFYLEPFSARFSWNLVDKFCHQIGLVS